LGAGAYHGSRRRLLISAVGPKIPSTKAVKAGSFHQPTIRRQSKEGIMYHFATTLIAGIIATVLVSGIAFVPTPAEAAKMSNAERVALEKATAACKEEAKGMKFSWHWRKRQKYVQNCIIRTANKEGVRVDIWQVRSLVNMKGLRPQRPGEWGCDPMC
jgi:hypothetical protein